MALTTEKINKMIVEATAGEAETSVPGKEAADYYVLLKADVQEMLAKGYTVLTIAE
jgi:hypothetical protein